MHTQIDRILYPKSIAVVGASSKPGTLSWELINNLVKFGYQGRIYPINPKADVIHCFKVYKSLKEIKEPVDLAIIMVGKNFALQAIDDCHSKKIDAVVLITAGFKETGEEGASLEKQLLEKIKKYKIRLVGPNCMGLINMMPGVSMNATFVKSDPIRGGIGFISQSGALGAAVLALLAKRDIGFSQFISIGNKADITENTVMEYWKDNDDVKVITFYLESFANPKEFLEIAKEITPKKPIIAIKAAKTASGQKAASSHTGALASADSVASTILEQAGVIRVDSVEDMFDLAKAFDKANLPKGNRLGILTNAGGPAILTADEADKYGLVLPALEPKTINALKKFAPEEASFNNPVDLLPPATPEMYKEATEIMLKDKNIDSLIIILGPPLMLDTLEIAKAISAGTKTSEKTSLLVLMSQDENIPQLTKVDPAHPPVYSSSESAARCIGLMYKYKLHREKSAGKFVDFEVNKNKVKKILKNQTKKGGFYLNFDEVCEILEAYGLPIIKSRLARNAQESVDMAEEIGFPVVIKAAGKKLVHKSDVGGVVLNIDDIDDLIQAESRVIGNLKEKGLDGELEGFIIQPFVKGGIETIFGITKDPGAGHLIMFGLGGVLVEVFKDVKFKSLPITDIEASELVKSIKSYKILEGVRGAKSVDIKFIEENILRLSQLVKDFPEFDEIDLNPFVLKPERKSCIILDARIKVIL